MKRAEPQKPRKKTTIGRRGFLKAVPTAIAAGIASPSLLAQQPPAAARPADVPPQRPTPPAAHFGKDALKSGEQIIGVNFTDAEEDMMLRGVSSNLDAYETLRKFDVPLDTEPAITFHPYLPGKKPQPGVHQKIPKLALKTAVPVPVTVGASLEDLAFLPVTVLARLIQTRKVSSLDLTKMYLDRLKRFGPKLLCVITLTEQVALDQAAAADKEIRAGKYRGPLHGIPWGAKDLFATKGYKTTWGAKPYENQLLDVDATVVERLREAGAVLVAKLSMGALAMGGVWFGGSTKNPWSPDRSSSGSSAGPAASTSAGLVGFGIGTETRGSIMSPSSTCGVVGLRPTYGRVSRYGAMALSWTMDKVGPICRTVEDCAVVLNAIYGPDGRDETVVDAPFNWNPEQPLVALRIGYVKAELEPQPPTNSANMTEDRLKQFEAQRQILADTLGVFKKMGATLEPAEFPTDVPVIAVNFILDAEGAAAFDDLTRTKGIDQLTAQGAGDWPNTFRTSRFIPAVEYIRAQRVRTLLIRRYEALMAKYDVILSTTRSGSLSATNLTGHPAMCMKMGFVNGMPQALMLTGHLYGEATMLRVALAYEQATKWHTMHPKLEG